MDYSVDPCDDFYMHVCGNYVKNTPIPDDKTEVNEFVLLDDYLRKQLNSILNTSINDDDIEPFKHCKRLYKACINQDLIEELGLMPLQRIIDSFGGWPVVKETNWHEIDWQKVQLETKLRGFLADYIFDCKIGIDDKNASQRVIKIDQMDLAISRENYANGFTDENVQAYYRFQVDTAVLFGADRYTAEIEMKNVLSFEIKLAEISTPKEERRNMTLSYNPMTIDEFQQLFPIHDWHNYFNMTIDNSTITKDEIIIVTDFKNIAKDLYKLLENTPNRVIVNYLIWRAVVSLSTHSNNDMRNLYMEFAQMITGKMKFRERWDECVGETLDNLQIATSALYVRNFFKQESRDVASDLVTVIRDEFIATLKSSDWMDDQTKEKALEKAEKMEFYVGFTDDIMDDEKITKFYKNLVIDEENYVDSIMNFFKFEDERSRQKFREPVIKNEWEENCILAVVNAFYSTLENSMYFPAGILQGVFFNADRPSYQNYGAIGAVIGHEITHGYDDEGSQLDGDGNLFNWWQEDTQKAYLEKAQCIIDQYSSYVEPITGMNLNGINTQGENIADIAGLKLAYYSYLKHISEHGEELPLPGMNYTSKQLFWISSAYPWCSVERNESLKLKVTDELHSPNSFRVNGRVVNMPEFAEDFNCPINSKMNPEHKCKVW